MYAVTTGEAMSLPGVTKVVPFAGGVRMVGRARVMDGDQASGHCGRRGVALVGGARW